MTLADLIDLEAQLARDRDADPAALAARDRALLAGAPVDAARRGDLLARWLAALRAAEPGRLHAGRPVASALTALRVVLALAGLVLGWAAAAAVLRYTGRDPVNVWDFLLAFVGVQALLLALLLASFFLPVTALGAPLLGAARGLLAAAYPRLAARGLGAGGERAAEWRRLWHHLRSRRSLYHHVEPWILLGLTQAFGVAFNVGAVLACLRLVAFSDVAFSWSTTLLQLDAARFHALVHALATPFAWLWPDASPSPSLVEATRYSRLEGAYVLSGARRAARPDLVGGWWPFLVASLAFYGLLPRVVTLAAAGVRTARLLARLPLDDAEVERVARRLAEPHVETRAHEPDGAAVPPARVAPRAAGTARDAERCAVVLWRDVPPRPELDLAVARQTGCAVVGVHAAGGRDFEEAAIAWDRLASGADRVVVVAEGWEAPDKAALRLVRDLRGALGPRRHVVVLLVDTGDGAVRPPRAPEVRIWEEGLARLEDPYLSVEPLREPA
jgi:hypothetical protein